MKTFRTVLPNLPAGISLQHSDRLLLIGSCFTESIGMRLADGKFKALINPNGIVYNPVSIARILAGLLPGAPPEPALFQQNGLWHSWEHHGHFSHPERETALRAMAESRARAADFLKHTNRLLITLGTAEVFTLRERGQVVANCHKAPADWFEQRRLSVDETVNALENTLNALKTQHPALEVLLTVSPVRHLRNGLVENQRSKAVLVLACAELCQRLGFVHYFPAYELLLDDLRDYRFYAADMTHPSEVAVAYIWSYFAEACFPPATRQLLEQIAKVTAAARHRPFNPGTPEHRTFARRQLEQIEQLEQCQSDLDFSEEKKHFQAQMA